VPTQECEDRRPTRHCDAPYKWFKDR
jgi:hypothetical protein